MGKYDDILKIPPPPTLTEMTPLERAAQFSSFAALSGFEEAIDDMGDKVLKLAEQQNFSDSEYWE
ncbi:MAG: hypothetical protein ACI4JS_02825 [Oscillospiraceae bacterium]